MLTHQGVWIYMKEIELINHRRGKGMAGASQGTEVPSRQMFGADGVSETRWALKSEDNVLSWGGDEVGVGLCKQTIHQNVLR